jgi:hypothetical protein
MRCGTWAWVPTSQKVPITMSESSTGEFIGIRTVLIELIARELERSQHESETKQNMVDRCLYILANTDISAVSTENKEQILADAERTVFHIFRQIEAKS